MEISKELKKEIQEKGYETRTGLVSFPKKLRDKYRAETGNYKDDEWLIKSEMIEIYNDV